MKYMCVDVTWSFHEVKIGNSNKRVTNSHTQAYSTSVFLTEWKYYIKIVFTFLLVSTKPEIEFFIASYLSAQRNHKGNLEKKTQRKCHLNIFKEKRTESQERKIGLCFSIIIVIVMMFGDHKSGYRNGWLQIVGSRNVFVENKTKYSNKQTTKKLEGATLFSLWEVCYVLLRKHTHVPTFYLLSIS